MVRNRKLYSAKRYVKRKSPTLLTIGNVIGVFVTGGLTAYSTVKAVRRYDKLKEVVENPTKKEILKAVAPCYILPLASAAATSAAGIVSNNINQKRLSMLSSALIASNVSLQEFKKKAIEKIGEEEVKKITTEVAKEKPIDAVSKEVLNNDEMITVYDDFSGYKFRTTMNKLLHAEQEVNRCLNDNQYGGPGRPGLMRYDLFFKLMDVPPTLFSTSYVWDTSDTWDLWDTAWVDFYHEETIDPNGGKLIILKYSIQPSVTKPRYIN